MQQPRGELVDDGEHSTLTFSRRYPHAPELGWDAISTPEGLREWLMCSHAVVEPRTGGRIELVSGVGRYHSTGRILVWEPPRVLEYEWNIEPVPEMPRGERAMFRYELARDGDATNVLVTYRRITKQTARGFVIGLHAFLERLEAQLAGTPCPDFHTRFTELHALYPEWSGHAPPSGQ